MSARDTVPLERATATIREGDILVVPWYGGFVVRHIVPRSEKTLAIGWIDLDCNILGAEELEAKAEKEGRRIVRFDMKAVPGERKLDEDGGEDKDLDEESWWGTMQIAVAATLVVVGCAVVLTWRRR